MSEQSDNEKITLPPNSLPSSPSNESRGGLRNSAPRISPDAARQIIADRRNKSARPDQVRKIDFLDSTGEVTATAKVVQSPASIAELARALQNNVDLIYFHVRNQIQYFCSYGLQKGSIGCLIDGIGNPWDQASLLVDLLREASYDADYLFGDIDLSNEEISAWLGTDTTNIFLASSVLTNGGIPNEPYWTGTVWRITLSHIWVKVTIDSTDFVLDPSYKTYTDISGIDLEAAMEYDQESLLNAADDGATHGADDLWLQNVNEVGINDELTSYVTNLIDWIKTNNPAATLDEILGGRRMNEVYSPVRQSTLPYETGEPTDWETIPNEYRATLRINWSTYTGIDETFYADELYGKRLTIFFNSSREPELRLDGTLIATGSAQSFNSYSYADITIEHPYSVTWFNQTFGQRLDSPLSGGGSFYYLIGTTFGATREGMVDFHKRLVSKAKASGATEFSDELLGEQLSVAWHTLSAESNSVADMACQMANCTFILHHSVGVCGRNSAQDIAFFDVLGGASALRTLIPDNDEMQVRCSFAFTMHANVLEQTVINQAFGTDIAAGSAKVLQVANADGTKIYLATKDNWSTDVYPNLTGYNMWLPQIYNWYLTWDGVAIVPEEGGQDIGFGSLTADGYRAFLPGGNIYGWIYTYKGALGPWGTPPTCKCKPCEEQKEDPVGLRSGAYNYRQIDLTVGSSSFPYSLSFNSDYSSTARFKNGPMGYGWSHNWQLGANKVSEPFRGVGSSPIEAAATIIELFANMDLVSNEFEILKLITASLGNSWWCNQMTFNVVSAQTYDSSIEFVRLPDGSFYSTQGEGWTVSENAGEYTVTTPQKVEHFYNTDGNLETITFPFGIIATLTYATGKLVSVDNGIGRSLNFNYTGEKLTSIDDDNSRTIELTFDGDELIAITDPLGEDSTFEYDEIGRMVSYFLPEHPEDPMVVNTYDSLDRIASQLDMFENEQFFYFAGWRTEFKNALGYSIVRIFDEYGNTISSIDELGNETRSSYDGLSRLIEQILPEGNRTLWEYNERNNVLTISRQPKPGSSLDDIIETFTWDATFNQISTFEDGNGNVAINSYDPATGLLLTVERPAVDGQVPIDSFSYNERGQILSQIDATGMQTQFSYDGSTENMLSSILNTNWTATIGGSATVSDIVTLTVHDTGLSGGQKSKSYTVITDDTLGDVAEGLAAEINADSEITDLGIKAKAFGTTISLSTSPGNATTFTESTSGGASETVTLAPGLNLTTLLSYNAWGDVDSVENPRGNSTALTSDEKRRLTQVESASPFEFITNLTYDKNDNRLTIERQTGDVLNPWQIYTSTYNLANLPESETDPNNNTISRLYDELRRLWKVTDGEDQTTEYQYTERSQLNTVTDPAMIVVQTISYTDNGAIATITDARGFATSFTQDGFDRPDKKIFPDGSFEQNASYDKNGNVLSRINRAGDSIAFEFDELNRMIQKSPDNMPVVSLEYDLVGRIKKMSTPVVSGDPASGEWKLSYDTAGRVTSEEAPDGKTVGYELDEMGNAVKLIYPDSWYIDRIFDQLDRLTDIKLNGDTDPAVHFDYDDLSRRTKLTFDNNTEIDTAFELNSNLSSLEIAFNGSSLEFAYGYNGANQLISQSVSDAQHLWHPTFASTIEYASNNLNEFIYASGSCGRLYKGYNECGCLIDDGVRRFGYDTENHLISVTDVDLSASYFYDPMHRQIQKNLDGTKTRFVYSGWQRLADYDGTSDTLQNRFVYGIALDEPLIAVSAGGTLAYLYADRLGSIIALADDSGTVTNRYKYSPYGESGSMDGTTFGFTGQRFDTETGLYYFKNRHYSPNLGSFLQPDLVSGMNLYTYVSSDPLNFTDPLGLEPAGTQSLYQQARDAVKSHPELFRVGCRDLVNYFIGNDPGSYPEEQNADCFGNSGAAKARADAMTKPPECCETPVIFVKRGRLAKNAPYPLPDGPIRATRGYPIREDVGTWGYFVYDSCSSSPATPLVGSNGPPTKTGPNPIAPAGLPQDWIPQLWCVSCAKKKTQQKCPGKK